MTTTTSLPQQKRSGRRWTRDVQEKRNFHYCCFCTDGKHVRMQASPHSGSLFNNTIIMLALVYAKYKPMVLTLLLEFSGSMDCIMLWSSTKLVCQQVTLMYPTSLLVMTQFPSNPHNLDDAETSDCRQDCIGSLCPTQLVD